jgi:hypothetical protein
MWNEQNEQLNTLDVLGIIAPFNLHKHNVEYHLKLPAARKKSKKREFE